MTSIFVSIPIIINSFKPFSTMLSLFKPFTAMLVHCLTHWGWMTHICVSRLTIIGSDNGLSPGRRQAIICTNTGVLVIWIIGTNFSEILSETHTFSFKKMHLKMSSGRRRPFCLGLNVSSPYRHIWSLNLLFSLPAWWALLLLWWPLIECNNASMC